MNRRDVLRTISSIPVAAAGATLLPVLGCEGHHTSASKASPPSQMRVPVRTVPNHPSNFNPAADSLMDELCARTAHYFVEQADPVNGLIYDRAHADGSPQKSGVNITSTAANGFGLSALCVAAQHRYLSPELCEQRMWNILNFFANSAPHQQGFFPHFFNAHNGVVADPIEFSPMDTALLLAGVLHARRFLNSSQVDALADTIYSRVNWPWMLNAQGSAPGAANTLTMGWSPHSGFLKARWDSYSECLLMYLMAIGAPRYPLQPATWNAIQRNTFDYGGIRFISSYGALFIHQYLHVWTDLRAWNDGVADYVQNSVAAIRAHKTWCMLQHGRFPWVDERVWGFSASDAPSGSYAAWAAPPVVGNWDGTLSPHAAGGSLTLLPEESIVVLKAMREHFGECFTRYGFVDAFNPGLDPSKRWFDGDVIAIDLALTMLMAENYRTGSVREAGMHSREVMNAMRLIGFARNQGATQNEFMPEGGPA